MARPQKKGYTPNQKHNSVINHDPSKSATKCFLLVCNDDYVGQDKILMQSQFYRMTHIALQKGIDDCIDCPGPMSTPTTTTGLMEAEKNPDIIPVQKLGKHVLS